MKCEQCEQPATMMAGIAGERPSYTTCCAVCWWDHKRALTQGVHFENLVLLKIPSAAATKWMEDSVA